MAYSTQRVTSDGTLALLDISIDYFDRTEIAVLFDGVVDALPWAWVGTTEKKISFSPAVPLDVEVLVRRTTQLGSVLHDFNGGAAFNATSMDENFQQVLRIAQEAAEGGQTTEFFSTLDMHGYGIVNLAAPLAPSSAARLADVQANNAVVQGYVAAALLYRNEAADFAAQAEASAAGVDTAYLLARHNHTGEQAITTVTGLQDALDTKASSASVAAGDAATLASARVFDLAGTAALSLAGNTTVFTVAVPAHAKSVYAVIHNASMSVAGAIGVQVGGSGGWITSGYVGGSTGVSNTAVLGGLAFSDSASFYPDNAAAGLSGTIHMTRVGGSTTWVVSGVVGAVGVGIATYSLGGHVVVPDLNAVRLVVSAGTFDSGEVSFMWE